MGLMESKEQAGDPPQLAPKGVSKVFQDMDRKNDGRIDRIEFCSYYDRHLLQVHEDPRGQLYVLERLVEEVRKSLGQAKDDKQDVKQVKQESPTVETYVVGERIK